MRRRGIQGWLIGVLLWLALASCAFAQEAQPTSTSAAAPPPGPVLLDVQTEPIRLDKRSRYFIDTAAQERPDGLEAEGEKTPWALTETRRGHRIDGMALWFQFDAQNTGAQRWYLEIGASGIDRVQLFYRGSDGRWVTQEAGDTRPVSDWPLPGRLPTFQLAGQTDKPVRYWLRIEYERVAFAAPLVLYNQSTLLASREAEQLLLGGYFSLAALIAVISAANAVVFRDRNFLSYAVYVISLAAGQLAYLGVGAQHLWDHWLRWNEMSTFVLPGVSAAAGLWFVRTVTEPARYSRALDLTVWAVIAALLSAVALDAVLMSRLSFTLVATLATTAVASIAALIALVWIEGDDTQVRLIALGFLPVLIAAAFALARGFNLIPVSFVTRYGVSIAAGLEMPILLYALSLRVSRRREAQVRAAALARNDALTGLAHTRTLLQRLESALARCTALKHAGALLGVKISNYEAIIEEFGRDAAERALVVAASILRRASTDIDMPARVGDHEFALLLEGPTTSQAATSRAQQLVAGGLRQADALPPGLVMKFHVAVAMVPYEGREADGTLNWVLDGVNAIRSDARKMIRPLNF